MRIIKPYSFSISKPFGKEYIFRIRKRDNKTLKQVAVHLPELESINTDYRSNSLSFDQALKQVKLLIKELVRERDSKLSLIDESSCVENRNIVRECWAKKFETRELVDPNSMKNDFNRAISFIGHLSLYSASELDLQTAVNKNITKPNIQRRMVARLNTLLKFVDRPFRLRAHKEQHIEVAFLTQKEVNSILPHLSPEMQLLVQVAFFTGMRLGELFAIRHQDVHKKHILVASQIDRKGTRRHTKNRKIRKVFYLNQYRPIVERWIDLDIDVKSKMRGIKAAELIADACRKVFKDKTKHIRFHDIRHSYAINLITNGVGITLVAQSLGNSILVCEKHYVGFVLNDESIEMMDRIMSNQIEILPPPNKSLA